MTEQRPSYSLRVKDDLIVLTTVGSQTVESIQAMRQNVEAALERGRGPKDILVITSGAGVPDKRALELSVQATRELPFRRLAVAGTFPERIGAARFVAKASGDGEMFKIFRLEEDARAWLEER